MSAENLRNEVENLLSSWNEFETSIGAPPVIDYDCRPVRGSVDPAPGRVHVYKELQLLRERAIGARADRLVGRIDCHLTYVSALLGERLSLGDFVRLTQGCGTAGWSDEYISWRGEQARKSLDALGISWGIETGRDFIKSETSLSSEEAPIFIQRAANEFEPIVRTVTGASGDFALTIEAAEVDAYWEFWLDGAGKDARLRLNMKNARFTDVQARQFAIHEVLGHALQSASYSARCETGEVPWVRILSVHAEHQVLLEGLAQALPLFIAPDDEPLIARVRFDYYTQLVQAELHLAINNGVSVSDCVSHAQSRAPFWREESIGRFLADRSRDAQLRSYLWSYPAGADWFISLAEADESMISRVLHAAYRDPLSPQQLTQLWPSGPTFGGPGGTFGTR